jgi:hypothetical protein
MAWLKRAEAYIVAAMGVQVVTLHAGWSKVVAL